MRLSKLFVASKSRQLSFTIPYTKFPAVCHSIKEHYSLYASIGSFLENGRRCDAWLSHIHAAYPELQKDTLHDALFRLVMRCFRNRASNPSHPNYDFVEFCAGVGNITFQLLKNKFVGLAIDIEYGQHQDMTSPEGTRLWLDVVGDTRIHSMNWLGTKCSPFVRINKNNNKRCQENQYLGDVTKEFVRVGNLQMEITALIVFVSFLSGNVPVLEQPTNSTMPLCDPLKCVLEHIRAHRYVTWLGAFSDTASPKPVALMSPSKCFAMLRRKKPPTFKSRCRLVKQSGTRYCGVKQVMKESQVYPIEFGKAVAEVLATKSWPGLG